MPFHIETETIVVGPAVPPRPEPAQPHTDSLDLWLHRHLDRVALAIICAAAVIRSYLAGLTYLNPDEAMHYLLINQVSVARMYKASLTNAHPPLFYLVLYCWHFLGRSELMLRMPSVLAGTAFCWVAFQWAKKIAGETTALLALILLAFSPATIALSAEVREYALMLFCIACALYFAARAFEEQSIRQMWLFSGFLYLAILCHYSVLFFTASIGFYALARLADLGFPKKLALCWCLGQAGALALYAMLYVTHVSKIKDNIAMWGRPFNTSYFHAGGEDIFAFTRINTMNMFLFFFAQRIVAWILLACFLAGVVLAFRMGITQRGRPANSDHFAILLLLPFAAVWGASLIGLYPYVGTRHTVFLEPFAVAGASYFIATILKQRIWAGALAAALLMSFSAMAAAPLEGQVSRGDNSPKVMSESIKYLKKTVPSGDHILVDLQSSLPLTYYFCGPRTIVAFESFQRNTIDFTCNGDPIVSLRIWKAMNAAFPDQFEMAVRTNGMKPGDRVWFYQAGWGETLDSELDRRDTKFRCLEPKHFGPGMVVIPFVVGPDYRPVARPLDSSCSSTSPSSNP